MKRKRVKKSLRDFWEISREKFKVQVFIHIPRRRKKNKAEKLFEKIISEIPQYLGKDLIHRSQEVNPKQDRFRENHT